MFRYERLVGGYYGGKNTKKKKNKKTQSAEVKVEEAMVENQKIDEVLIIIEDEQEQLIQVLREEPEKEREVAQAVGELEQEKMQLEEVKIINEEIVSLEEAKVDNPEQKVAINAEIVQLKKEKEKVKRGRPVGVKNKPKASVMQPAPTMALATMKPKRGKRPPTKPYMRRNNVTDENMKKLLQVDLNTLRQVHKLFGHSHSHLKKHHRLIRDMLEAGSFFGDIWNGIKQISGDVYSAIKTPIQDLYSGTRQAVSDTWNKGIAPQLPKLGEDLEKLGMKYITKRVGLGYKPVTRMHRLTYRF